MVKNSNIQSQSSYMEYKPYNFTLTAESARISALGSTLILKRIEKMIREVTLEGGYRLTYLVRYIFPEVVTNVVNTLRTMGYDVILDEDPNDPEICEIHVAWNR